MQYGICHLSVVSVRASADDASEMVTQLLYGDHFKVLEQRKFWSRIRIAFDGYEGWVSTKQFQLIEEGVYKAIVQIEHPRSVSDLIAFASAKNDVLIPIPLGACVEHMQLLTHDFEGNYTQSIRTRDELIDTALLLSLIHI